jgi:predicted RNA-binding Zn-ribbon protein involved in translation (DUF1610 family)
VRGSDYPLPTAHFSGYDGCKENQAMANLVACAACGAQLRVRDEYLGRAMQCPKCGQQVQPTAPLDSPKAAAPSDGIPTVLPARKQLAPNSQDDERQSLQAYSSYAPCPRCGSTNAERVVWTVWGSFYGPAILNHVHCLSCGNKYNGRSGRSNLIPATIFVLVPLLLILAIIVGLFFWLWRVLHWHL